MITRLGRPTAAWLFGVSLTILFVALWGRAVVVDTETLGEAAAPLAESAAVVDLVADWAADEFVDAGADPTLVRPTIDYLVESTAVGGSLEQFVSELIEAASSAHPGGSSIDMRELLTPVVPEISVALVEVGVPATTDEVSRIVNELDPLVIREPGEPALIGPSSPTASRLGTATLLAAAALFVFGYSFVAWSDDRTAAVRELMTRIALGGVSFAIFLRVGSWVLDPRGGRAPIPETLSNIAGSKWVIPVQVAAVAGAIALAMYLVRRWLRRGEVFPEADVPPRPLEEQPLSLSGLR